MCKASRREKYLELFRAPGGDIGVCVVVPAEAISKHRDETGRHPAFPPLAHIRPPEPKAALRIRCTGMASSDQRCCGSQTATRTPGLGAPGLPKPSVGAVYSLRSVSRPSWPATAIVDVVMPSCARRIRNRTVVAITFCWISRLDCPGSDIELQVSTDSGHLHTYQNSTPPSAPRALPTCPGPARPPLLAICRDPIIPHPRRSPLYDHL